VLLSWTLSAILVAVYRRRVDHVLASVERPEQELELLAVLLQRLERTRFRSPMLVELTEGLAGGGPAPSRRIRKLARLVDLIDSRHNMIFAAVSALLFLGTQFAFAVERWRVACGDGVERWLAAVGEIEALCSIAAYAYEHPDDPFPEVAGRGPRYVAEALGHPLLPGGGVRNDVTLGEERAMILVSGSNMSGKSTLLRSVGVSAVMAQAGAPVRARRLALSALSVGAAMRVTDSLQQGLSHFYAEIRRLKRILEIGEREPPLLFLLDEILHGTNSHDRRIGAAALIRRLVEQGSVGLVTTHDLALARIAEELAPRAANVHFEDRLDGERIVFDYRLRPGVVERGNAVGLMRAIGLPV
jgi:DNA mismatch repair ATPase MutS